MGGHEASRPPATARRVALVAAGDAPAAEALLADIAQALPVYARLAGVTGPDVVHTTPGRGDAGCDTVLLALGAGEPPRLGGLAAGTRVYALLYLGGRGPESAEAALGGVQAACFEAGLSWRGGLVVSEAEHLARLMRTPRMGWARRRVSEATDRLIMALLSGRPLPPQCTCPSRLVTRVAGLLAMVTRVAG